MPYETRPRVRAAMYDPELSRMALENAERIEHGEPPLSDPEIVERWLSTEPAEEE